MRTRACLSRRHTGLPRVAPAASQRLFSISTAIHL